MKKLILTAMAVFAMSSMNAQEDKIRFGAKAGLNLSNITGDETDDLKMRTAFHLGVLAEIPLTDVFAFQPELMYSAQGARIDQEGFDVIAKYDYLNIPLMFKYYPVEGFSIQAGPQVGFLVSAKAVGEFSAFGVGDDVDEEIEDASSIDLGLNVGLGYQLDMGLFFDGRYNLGLSNNYDGEGSDDFKNSNAVIQFSVGYKF